VRASLAAARRARHARRGIDGRRSRGAALVEFALVAPLLFILLFGIIEFGFAFVQWLDVRHGARETARLVAVNYKPTAAEGGAQAQEILIEGCARMDDGGEGRVITIVVPSGQSGDPGEVGQRLLVTVDHELDGLTGFFPFIAGRDVSSEVVIRAEVDATWTAGYGTPESRTCP
jgi:Flp pilus assembly protein TadG